MAKLNKRERERLTYLVRELVLKCYNEKEIKTEIENIFGVVYSYRSITYYKQKAFHEEWLKELRKQNEIVNRWNENLNTKTDPTELLAESIYLAVSKGD